MTSGTETSGAGQPGDVLASLADACRKGHVASIGTLSLQRHRRGGDYWAIPAFAFGDPITFAVFRSGEATRAGADLLRDGKLPLPYDECALIYTSVSDETHGPTGERYRQEHVARLRRTEDGFCVVLYDRDHTADGHTIRYPVADGGRFEWHHYDYTLEFSRSEMELRSPSPSRCDADREQDGRWCMDRAETIVGMLYLLTLSNTGTREAVVTERERRVNEGREHAGLRRLPPIRIVHLEASPRTDQEERHGAGMPPLDAPGERRGPVAPHVRRGHLRRLLTGRIVPVRPTVVHGGGDVPPVYVVRP